MPQSNQQDSKPSAPQAENVNEIWDIRHPAAESVPSGKDAAHKWLDAKVGRPFSERHEFTDHNGRTWNLATLLSEYAAALADERDQAKKLANIYHAQYTDLLQNHAEDLERSNSLLRERITAAEGLLQDNPHDAWCDNSECLYCKNKDAYFEKENQ